MRLLMILLLAIILSACQTVTPPMPVSEEGVNAEAEQLIRFSLTERLVQNTREYYRNQISSMFASQEKANQEVNRIIEEELNKVVEAEHQRLVDGLVPIYRKNFTAEEIHQLLSFYQTEVARKSIRISSQIAAESQQFVRLWSENFGNLLTTGIDKQLTAAGISMDR